MIDIKTTISAADKAKINSIDNKVDKMEGYGLSQNNFADAEKEYIDNLLYGQYYTLTTSASSRNYFCDDYQDTEGYDMTVTVTSKYDDVAVDVDSVPSGWVKTANKTGEYKRTINIASGTDKTVPATTFSYTYDGVTLNKQSVAYTGALSYPIYIGLFDKANLESAKTEGETDQQAVTRIVASLLLHPGTTGTPSLGRVTANMTSSTKYTITNNLNSKAYIWMVTPNTITISQLGNPIAVNKEQGTFTFNSPRPNKGSITLSNYFITVDNAGIDPGGSASYEFTSNIKSVS